MAKFAPLALVPIFAPPLATVYQRMVFPAEVAFRLVDAPEQRVVGVAVTGVGTNGNKFTVTGTVFETAEEHPATIT